MPLSSHINNADDTAGNVVHLQYKTTSIFQNVSEDQIFQNVSEDQILLICSPGDVETAVITLHVVLISTTYHKASVW